MNALKFTRLLSNCQYQHETPCMNDSQSPIHVIFYLNGTSKELHIATEKMIMHCFRQVLISFPHYQSFKLFITVAAYKLDSLKLFNVKGKRTTAL